MDFTYEATGGIELYGCAAYKLIHYRYYQFGIGSILFSRKKAMKGVYEKIAIKSVRFPDAFTNLYVDTFNGLWTENELVSYTTATALVEDFVIRRNAIAEQAVRMCKPPVAH